VSNLYELADQWLDAHDKEFRERLESLTKHVKETKPENPFDYLLQYEADARYVVLEFAIRCSIHLMERLRQDLSRELRAEIDELRSQLLERLDQLGQR